MSRSAPGEARRASLSRGAAPAWRAVAWYGAVSGAVVLAGVLLVGLVVEPTSRGAVRLAGSLAYLVQVVAFGALVLAQRRSTRGFLLAWAGGSALRFGVVLAGGAWLVQAAGYPPLAMLLSMTGFVFILLMLEPVFFRMGAVNR